MLDSRTLSEYINAIIDKAVEDGNWSAQEIFDLDKQGLEFNGRNISNIIAGIDDSLNYDNNGNQAEVIGRLMHASGKNGAFNIAQESIDELANKTGMSIIELLHIAGYDNNDNISNHNVNNDLIGIRKYFEDLGYNVGWDNKTKEFLVNNQRFSSSDYQRGENDSLLATTDQLKEILNIVQTANSNNANLITPEDYIKKLPSSIWSESLPNDYLEALNGMSNSTLFLNSMNDLIGKINSNLSTLMTIEKQPTIINMDNSVNIEGNVDSVSTPQLEKALKDQELNFGKILAKQANATLSSYGTIGRMAR